jgi:hypothetical protein
MSKPNFRTLEIKRARSLTKFMNRSKYKENILIAFPIK